MKKVGYLVLLFLVILIVSSCSNKDVKKEKQEKNKYITGTADEDDNITLDTTKITKTATFVTG